MITTRSATLKLLKDAAPHSSDAEVIFRKCEDFYSSLFPLRSYLNHELSADSFSHKMTPSLPTEIIHHIMDFADPSTLLNMASSSKCMMDNVRYSTVVASALLCSSSASKETVKRIHNLLHSECINVPSPQRLLRLVCGKRCEFCCLKPVDSVDEHFGVFICEDCSDSENPRYFKVLEKSGRRYHSKKELIDYLLDDKWVITHRSGFRDVPEREAIQEHMRAVSLDIPLRWRSPSELQVQDLHNLVWNTKVNDRFGETIGPVLSSHDLARVTTILGSAHRDDWNELFTIYFYSTVGAVSLDHSGRQEIFDTFNKLIDKSQRLDDRLQWKLQMAHLKMNLTAKVEAINFVETLKTYIDDPALCDEIFTYLDCRGFDVLRSTNNAGIKGPIEFGYFWMDELLQEPIKNAKKYGKRQFRVLAKKVKKAAYKNLDEEIYSEFKHFAMMPSP